MRLLACAVAAMAMALVAGAAEAGDWRAVSEGPNSAEFLNMEGMRTESNRNKVVWTAIVWAKQADSGDYVVIQKEFNCAAITMRIVSAYIYDRNDTVMRFGAVEEEAQSLVPDSNGYDMYEVVCGLRNVSQNSYSRVRDGLNRYRGY